MLNLKSSILAGALAAAFVWGAASMMSVADPSAAPTMVSQIDTFALMSTRTDIPTEAYDSF
jgi:hypothetical protein